MAQTITERFGAWVEWLRATGSAKSQDAVALKIGCSQALVSKLLAGEKVSRFDTAQKIERASAEWPDGPIRVGEWHGEESERAAS